MKCPRDGTELAPENYEGDVEVDVCPRCGGMFLDDGELEVIQKTVERDHSALLNEPLDSVKAGMAAASNEALGPVACPKCGVEMTGRRYGLGSQVQIDVCAEGCGLWLDSGELEALEAFYESSQEDIPLTWRLWAAVRGAFASKR